MPEGTCQEASRRQRGGVIRELRREAGLSQEELARRAGIRQATLSDIENEAVSAHLSSLRCLASTLGVPVSRIARVSLEKDTAARGAA